MIWNENGLGVCMILWLTLLWIETIGREEVGGKGIMRIKLSEYQRCFFFFFTKADAMENEASGLR